MILISLRDIIDDILLMVRNNNISESEDLSRAQIMTWVKAYRSKLYRDRMDYLKQLSKVDQILAEELADDLFIKMKEVGPLELETEMTSNSDRPTFTKRTKEPLKNVFNNSENSILSVHDLNGEVIQYTNHIKRHYQYFRKYTFGELTAYYEDDGHIYVLGVSDKGLLKYIYVLALFEEPDGTDEEEENDMNEEDIKIPGWMVPNIKELIIKNELAFMLNRPSDDSNNATLASVKPHGPQDDEE